MKPVATIPIASLEETVYGGFFISRYNEQETTQLVDKALHRDDHYIFIIQEQGQSLLMLDFEEITINDAALLCVLPGQIHRAVAAENTIAWFIVVKTEFIKEAHRAMFQEKGPLQQAIPLQASMRTILQQTLLLFSNTWASYKSGALNVEIIRSLADGVFGMLAKIYCDHDAAPQVNESSALAISRSFKTLVGEHYKTCKAPSEYAKKLNISDRYLYEVTKKITGFSPSYWIQQEVMTEAKRILFFTNLSVKQIAVTLGFDDHHYFSRFFTRSSGISPLQFRKQSRE